MQLIKQKRCGKIKGRTCADGRKQRQYINQEDSTPPTVSTEALLITLMVDALENRDVATSDVPGAFLHSDMDEDVTVIVDGALVELLVQSNNKYAKFVHICRDGKKVVFLKLDKALYGTVRAARLFWENLSGTLREYGFETNPYDACVMNMNIEGKQCTIVWHVDDLKISHVDESVINDIITKLESNYGKMSMTVGKRHTYVGMNIQYNDSGTVTIDMVDYVKECLAEFPETLEKEVKTPAASNLFEVRDEIPLLDPSLAKLFHRIVAKLLFVCKRARPDIQVPIAFLSTRTTKSNEDDWRKLRRLMRYLQFTSNLVLTLKAEDLTVIKWWVDASYAVHDNMRSHTGATMTLGGGALYSKSSKQKLNTKSSTEAELVAASDMVGQILWTKEFLANQGYQVKRNILYQDNKSAILLEKNGSLSSSQKTRHINVRYFFIKDKVDQGDIEIVYCPTGDMLADFFTKPLQGNQFIAFRERILGLSYAKIQEGVAGPVNTRTVIKASEF